MHNDANLLFENAIRMLCSNSNLWTKLRDTDLLTWRRRNYVNTKASETLQWFFCFNFIAIVVGFIVLFEISDVIDLMVGAVTMINK